MCSRNTSEVNPIEQWQESVPDGEVRDVLKEANHGLISELSATASSLFLSILKTGSDQFPEKHVMKIRREYGCFQLWCDGYDVLPGELDDILAGSTRLRHSTYRRLIDVCQALLGLNSVISAPKASASEEACRLSTNTKNLLARAVSDIMEGDDSDSDTSSDVDPLEVSLSPSTPENLLEDLATGIECVADLGPCFEDPVLDAVPAEEKTCHPVESTWDPVVHLAARISHRYPDVDGNLARALGSANWERLQRLVQTRHDNIQEKRTAPLEGKDTGPGTVVASDYHDSGIGTSITSPASRYAETVLSYHGSNGGSIRIPRTPAQGLRGELFTCEICAAELQIPVKQAKSLWKKHVFSDLRPYTCIKPTCDFSSVQFADKQAWINHLAAEHSIEVASDSIKCPLCRDELRSNKISHLANHLEEISLTILSAAVEEEDGKSDSEEEALTWVIRGNEKEDKVAGGAEGEDNKQPEPLPKDPPHPRPAEAKHRRGPWSHVEDNSLFNLVRTHGPHNWVKIASNLGSRTPKQCRERYHQSLKPTLNHGPITPEEGILIEKFVNEMGKRWAEIARRLPGRSDAAVKGWWNGAHNRRKRAERKTSGHDGTGKVPEHDSTTTIGRQHSEYTSGANTTTQWASERGPYLSPLWSERDSVTEEGGGGPMAPLQLPPLRTLVDYEPGPYSTVDKQ